MLESNPQIVMKYIGNVSRKSYKAIRKHVYKRTKKRFADKQRTNRKHRFERNHKRFISINRTFRGNATEQIANSVLKTVNKSLLNRFSIRLNALNRKRN